MNKPLRRVSVFCLLLVGALLLRANWVQVVKASDYANNPNNTRSVYEMYEHPRGNFLVDGKPITGSDKATQGQFVYQRTYLDGPEYAAVTGYRAPLYGKTYLESIEDAFLAGTDDRLTVRNFLDVVQGNEQRGGDVALTINGKAQDAAWNALQGKTGAAVAIDPTTGRILAMVSSPSFDPNKLSQGTTAQIGNNATALQNDPSKPMDNRAIRYTYPPGSTFKMITAAAALSSGQFQEDTVPGFPSPLDFPNSVKSLPDDLAGCQQKSVKQAFEDSCNTVFAGIGNQLGAAAVQKQAEAFGFNDFGKASANLSDTSTNLFIPSRVVPSVFPTNIDGAQTMLSSIGQYNTAATPLQMAMVAAAIDNDGKVMQPYLVDQLRTNSGSVIEQTSSKQLSQAVTPDVAQKLQDMMQGVVTEGTGQKAQIPGVTVGGKTGTAQHGVNNDQNPYAWFVSYANGPDGKKVAVAVVVENPTNDPTSVTRDEIAGGSLAAPIAKQIMQAVVSN